MIATTSSQLLANINDSLTNFWQLLFGIIIGLIPSFAIYKLQSKKEEEVKVREASITVAELLSEWVKTSYTGEENNTQRWQLQSLYWKTILRLDKRLIDVLIPRLANAKEAKDINEIIVKCRQALLGLTKPDLNALDLNNWPPVKKRKL